jgi:hypothetical protein
VRFLKANGCSIDIDSLFYLENLEHLELAQCSLKDLGHICAVLRKFKHLTTLVLAGNHFSRDFPLTYQANDSLSDSIFVRRVMYMHSLLKYIPTLQCIDGQKLSERSRKLVSKQYRHIKDRLAKPKLKQDPVVKKGQSVAFWVPAKKQNRLPEIPRFPQFEIVRPPPKPMKTPPPRHYLPTRATPQSKCSSYYVYDDNGRPLRLTRVNE